MRDFRFLASRAKKRKLHCGPFSPATSVMPPVFNRYPVGGLHIYDDVLGLLSASSEPSDQALATNVRYDHRVTLDRERQFGITTGRPGTGPAFLKALRDYLWDRVRTQANPDFLDPRLNAGNILTDGRPGLGAIHPDHEVVRVLDLNGLQTVYGASKSAVDSRGRPIFDDFPMSPDATSVLEWLDEKLGRGPAETELFIAATLRALGEYALRHPYHPSWCTSWSDFAPHATEMPDRWGEIVGVPNTRGVARWLIILRYSVREAGTLCRPTQLDAGDYQWHFPSPPSRPATGGGSAMDLALTAPPVLRCEYIHMQIPHSIDHWFAAGRLLGRGGARGPAQLREMRMKHRQVLQTSSPGDADWMPAAM